ncbi:glycosyltransferase family 2 protein [Dyadobacter luticola]|nr:glycosyltransferase [Dyadobacter luticola]
MIPVNISVVIPTFRRPTLLQKCLAAICNQTYPGCYFEVLIVSDGPDPDTEKLVDELTCGNSDCIRYTHLESKKGPAAARNYGWKISSGELIVFTDDDTIPDPDWLASYWRAYRFHDRQEIAFTGRVHVPIPELPTDYEKNVANLSTAEFVTANCACSREALELTGGFDESFPAAWREDSDLQFKLLENQIPIARVPEASICHPAREARWGVSLAEQKKSMFNALLFKKHPDFYRKRISSGPVWNYYTIIAASILAILGYAMHIPSLGFAALAVWIFSVGVFIVKRLRGTNASFSHRMEMIVTSLLIPYLSVYWTIRGALRYKVFFL